MKISRRVAVAIIGLSFPLSVHAQELSALVPAYLAANNLSWSPGDWTTCQPPGQTDQICTWASKLGTQPTTEQLAGYAPAVAAKQQALQRDAILAAGVAVSSIGTPSLSGTYPTDPVHQGYYASEVTSILLNGTFTNGQATKPWFDTAGAVHVFTIVQFKALATVVAAYVDSVLMTSAQLSAGQTASWPEATATIP